MTAAETEGMRAIETAIHHLVRRLLKAIDHHEGYRLYAAEFNRLKSCARLLSILGTFPPRLWRRTPGVSRAWKRERRQERTL
jgi:hypothetical protein